MEIAGSVRKGTYDILTTEISAYDDLTIGDAEQHLDRLTKAVQFGGGCLTVIFHAGDKTSGHAAHTQPETLFDIEEVA